MGLADLLRSRAAGGGQAQQRSGAKRARQEDGPAALGPALPASLNGHAAVFRPAKLTRTALRKQHKARRLAAQQQREAAEQAAAQQAQQNGSAGPAGGSDNEEEEDGLGLPTAAAALAGGAGGGAGSVAYSVLLGALQHADEAFADLYQQRRREQAGMSDEESSEEEEEEGSSDEGSEGEGDDDIELGSGDELEGEGVSDQEAEGEQGGEGRQRAQQLRRGGAEEEQEGAEAEAAGGASSGDEEWHSVEEGLGGEGEEPGGEAHSAGAQAGQAEQGQGGLGGGEGERPPAGPAVEDHFADQFDRMLTDAQVAALSAREAGAAPKFEDCTASFPWLAQWKATSLEATPGARLPQQAPAELAAYGVRERLQTRWHEEGCGRAPAAAEQQQQGQQHKGRQREEVAAAGGSASGCGDFATPQQQALFALLSSYCDVLHPCRPYPTDPDAPDPELDAVLLHMVNHCTKAAERVRKNNERLKAKAAAAKARAKAKARAAAEEQQGAAAAGKGGGGGEQQAGAGEEAKQQETAEERKEEQEEEEEEPPRDQGFVRPKVLLLLPYRHQAHRAVLRLLKLAVKETRKDTIQNKERFEEEFGPGDEELTEREQRAIARKPSDYRALFGGNMDDHFRMGIKLTRGAVRLYTDFFQSDIIVSSPLALATKLGEGTGEDGISPQDALASIEVLVAERADVMLMQNWSHVVTVFEALNHMPQQQHGVDIMRVREWALSGWARLYRQTILLSSFAAPEMNALLARKCANHAGGVRLRPAQPGVLQAVLPQVRQVFERLPAAEGGLAAEPDARFEYFKKVAWQRIREAGRGGGQLIYVPSYFDFVRVRNFLKSEAASFLVLSEYTEKADAARARSYFFDGRKQVLLCTERAQFYNRNRIRGIKDVLFYQLPEHAHFYPELLNLLEEGGASGGAGEHGTVSVLFGKSDALRLERVVGSARSGKMLRGSTPTFLFC